MAGDHLLFHPGHVFFISGESIGLRGVVVSSCVEPRIGKTQGGIGIGVGSADAGAGVFDEQLGVVIDLVLMGGAGSVRSRLRETGATDQAGIELRHPLSVVESGLHHGYFAAVAVIILPLVEGV